MKKLQRSAVIDLEYSICWSNFFYYRCLYKNISIYMIKMMTIMT